MILKQTINSPQKNFVSLSAYAFEFQSPQILHHFLNKTEFAYDRKDRRVDNDSIHNSHQDDIFEQSS